MTDPIEQAMRELNEAVRRRDAIHAEFTGEDIGSWAHRRNADLQVERLRERYNAAIIAYGDETA